LLFLKEHSATRSRKKQYVFLFACDSMLWSAAACRRFLSYTAAHKVKAAASRRTPKRSAHLLLVLQQLQYSRLCGADPSVAEACLFYHKALRNTLAGPAACPAHGKGMHVGARPTYCSAPEITCP
jgi:glutathione S-transferase